MKDNLKITIDQLKNYLGTGLKFNADDYYSDEYETVLEVIELIGLNSFWFIEGRLPDFKTVTEDFEIAQIKPICYRLSDLDKFIPELGFVPSEEIGKFLFRENPELFDDSENAQTWFEFFSVDPLKNLTYSVFEILFHWHFWLFGDEYFEQGLVIDKLK